MFVFVVVSVTKASLLQGLAVGIERQWNRQVAL